VNDVVYNLPSNKGLGTFVWEPEEFDGDTSKPLFDWKNNPAGRHSNARLELYPQMAIDYAPEEVTPVLNTPSVEKNAESIRMYFDGSRVLIKKTLSNGKVRIFDLKGKER